MTVDARDPYGNIDTTYNGDVTLALATSPTALRWGNADRGGGQRRASFSDLTLNKVGTGYTFTASNDSLTAATSDSFDVTDRLVVTAQPPSTITAGSRSAWSSRPKTAMETWTPRITAA